MPGKLISKILKNYNLQLLSKVTLLHNLLTSFRCALCPGSRGGTSCKQHCSLESADGWFRLASEIRRRYIVGYKMLRITDASNNGAASTHCIVEIYGHGEVCSHSFMYCIPLWNCFHLYVQLTDSMCLADSRFSNC